MPSFATGIGSWWASRYRRPAAWIRPGVGPAAVGQDAGSSRLRQALNFFFRGAARFLPGAVAPRHVTDRGQAHFVDGKGGEGIFHLVAGEKNISSILEQSTQFETTRVMAQEYLPAIRLGDKRILLLEGEPIGALLRVPADAEVRANLHVGGRAEKAQLNEADREIIRRLGPVLKREGLFFVGIDVIGDRLTEINLTSPMGIQEINALDGTCLEVLVIDAVEARLAGRA